jgi:phosphoglycolate phosphatase
MNGAMRQTIIFDLDGTLVDSCTVCVEILQDMVFERAFDYRIDPVIARQYMSRGGEMMVASLLGPAARDSAADLAEFRERYSHRTTPKDALFAGVVDGLRALSDCGFDLAICSNKPQMLCDKVLHDTALAGHFRVVVGGQAGLRPKPATDLLDHTLSLLARSAKQCVYVGDSELDHETASARGVPFHFVTYGYADPDWEPAGCHVHSEFRQLVKMLTERAVLPVR